MKDYPQLAEMGIANPRHIKKYLVNSIENLDVLRIVYERRTGSLLPTSRTYEFPRVQKTVKVGSSKPQTAVVMETNPVLRAALDELQRVCAEKGQKQDMAESIIEELRLLEEDIALRSAGIKELLKRI